MDDMVYDHPDGAVHETDIPNQINAQVPAKFGFQQQQPQEEGDDNESETDYDQQAYIPSPQMDPQYEQENVSMVPNVPVQDLYMLQERNKNQMIVSKIENYNDLYNPLSDSVATAKLKHKKMSDYEVASKSKDHLHESIMSKRKGLKNELYSYLVETKAHDLKSQSKSRLGKRSKKAKADNNKKEKVRQKVYAKKVQSTIEAKAKSRMLRRDAMQVKINKRLQELASKLEREKLIEEKKTVKDFNYRIDKDKKNMIESFSKFWDDQIKLTKERIEEEKLNRKLVETAEKESLSQWKKQINTNRQKKLDKYFNILEQQDVRYEVENLDLDKMEEQLIKMYKKS
jgi:hypothetical protein